MRDVLVHEDRDAIDVESLPSDTAVFAVDTDGDIQGMIIKEAGGYITRKHDGTGSSGHHPTLAKCVRIDSAYWDFITN
jgi:hypothetical protein